MEKKITAELHVHNDNICDFLNKNVSSNLTKSLLFIGEQAGLAICQIEEE